MEKFTLSGDHKGYYALHREEHKHYFLCTECHRRIELTDCPLHDYKQTLQDKLGLEIRTHSLHLAGLCNTCKGREK